MARDCLVRNDYSKVSWLIQEPYGSSEGPVAHVYSILFGVSDVMKSCAIIKHLEN